MRDATKSLLDSAARQPTEKYGFITLQPLKALCALKCPIALVIKRQWTVDLKPRFRDAVPEIRHKGAVSVAFTGQFCCLKCCTLSVIFWALRRRQQVSQQFPPYCLPRVKAGPRRCRFASGRFRPSAAKPHSMPQ